MCDWIFGSLFPFIYLLFFHDFLEKFPQKTTDFRNFRKSPLKLAFKMPVIIPAGKNENGKKLSLLYPESLYIYDDIAIPKTAWPR